MMEPPLSVAQFAKRFSICVATVRRLLDEGRLGYTCTWREDDRTGKRYRSLIRIHSHHVRAWQDESECHETQTDQPSTDDQETGSGT